MFFDMQTFPAPKDIIHSYPNTSIKTGCGVDFRPNLLSFKIFMSTCFSSMVRVNWRDSKGQELHASRETPWVMNYAPQAFLWVTRISYRRLIEKAELVTTHLHY
jgi:hypothetical protein